MKLPNDNIYFLKAIHLLQTLGGTANYAGFFQTAYAISLAAKDPEKLQFVTKLIYPDVAVKYKTSCDSVEKNIRKIIQLMWERTPDALSKIAGYEIDKVPVVSEFLAILTLHLVLESPQY